MKGKIYAYNTHYEIIDYELGDFPQLERDLSTWDDITHRLEPKFYYDTDNKVIYIPRGYDPNILANHYNTFIDFIDTTTDKKKVSFNIQSFPRNAAQKESVRFLSGRNEYSHMYNDTQQVLSMPPGEGKTYCAISALALLGYRCMVVVNTVNLRDQWRDAFKQYTGIPDNYIKELTSVKEIEKLILPKNKRMLNGVVAFLVVHDTLQNYMKKHGNTALGELFNQLQIGVKVIDEAHLDYNNTLMLDYMTNVWKTFYLSATFARSDGGDDKVFQKSFNMVHKLKIESETKRRHVIYMPYIYRTSPSALVRETVRGLKGFDRYRYSDYEFSQGRFEELITRILDLFINKRRIEGKIVILSSKKESCDKLLSLVNDLYPAYSACAHYTGNKKENFKEYGIICATPKMLGTGEDIPGLRVVINLEPSRSTIAAQQIVGRLREYAPDKDTYYIELVDKAFSNVYDMYKTRLKFLSSVIKEAKIIDETVVRY